MAHEISEFLAFHYSIDLSYRSYLYFKQVNVLGCQEVLITINNSSVIFSLYFLSEDLSSLYLIKNKDRKRIKTSNIGPGHEMFVLIASLKLPCGRNQWG